jgi:phosphotransferase system enzyme I (PtsI)
VFLTRLDFLSIGTNDLIQYTLAVDRADEAVAHLYDPWHPAVLQLIWQTIDQSRQAGRHVSVCGEMAGDPAFTSLLLAMGLRSFSMHPSQIAAIKQRILRADTSRLAPRLAAVLRSEDPQAACAALESLAASRATQPRATA